MCSNQNEREIKRLHLCTNLAKLHEQIGWKLISNQMKGNKTGNIKIPSKQGILLVLFIVEISPIRTRRIYLYEKCTSFDPITEQ